MNGRRLLLLLQLFADFFFLNASHFRDYGICPFMSAVGLPPRHPPRIRAREEITKASICDCKVSSSARSRIK